MSNAKQAGLPIEEQTTILTISRLLAWCCSGVDYGACPVNLAGIGCPFEEGGCTSATVEQWIKVLQNREIL